MIKHLNKREKERIYRSLRRIFKSPYDMDVIYAEVERAGIAKCNQARVRNNLKSVLSNGTGYCSVLHKLFDLDLVSSTLPELMKQKPADRFAWWWSPGDNESRVRALNRVLNKFKH